MIRTAFIPSYVGLYSIRDDGVILRHERTAPGAGGSIRRIKGGVMKLFPQRNGYLRAVLTDAEGKRTNHMVHRLVASVFVAASPGRELVNHKDGNKRNNAASNLEWVTRSENVKHAITMGLLEIHRGEHGRISSNAKPRASAGQPRRRV